MQLTLTSSGRQIFTPSNVCLKRRANKLTTNIKRQKERLFDLQKQTEAMKVMTNLMNLVQAFSFTNRVLTQAVTRPSQPQTKMLLPTNHKLEKTGMWLALTDGPLLNTFLLKETRKLILDWTELQIQTRHRYRMKL